MKNYNIIIKTEDIKEDRTGSGQLIDKIAIAMKQWTADDLYEYNTEYQNEGSSYVLEHYDFEEGFLTWLNGKGKAKTETLIKQIAKQNPNAKNEYKKSGLLPGAFLALEKPKRFTGMLSAWREMIEEEAGNFYDSEMLREQALDLLEELEESEKNFWENLRNEWLYGDRSEIGLIGHIKKDFNCEDLEYNEKKDELILNFTQEEAEDLIYNYGDEEEKPTKKKIFELITNRINTDQAYFDDEDTKKREERKIERLMVEKYQKEQRKKEKEERRERLLKMKRKK